jgi:hypothetical protein
MRENLANIKYGHSIDTDNIGHTRHSATQTKQTRQHIKLTTRAKWMPSNNDILEHRFLQHLIILRRRLNENNLSGVLEIIIYA